MPVEICVGSQWRIDSCCGTTTGPKAAGNEQETIGREKGHQTLEPRITECADSILYLGSYSLSNTSEHADMSTHGRPRPRPMDHRKTPEI